MIELISTLKNENIILYAFGLSCFLLAVLFLLLSTVNTGKVAGANKWYKPIKFALSIGLFSWTMGLYCTYLLNFDTITYSWWVVILLGFEVVYIAIQAARGKLSHFNNSSPFYSFMFTLMGLAISALVFYTAYVGFLFFINDFPQLPEYYLWSIRIGILIFIIFSFEGFLMGARLAHTIGGTDGGPGIPFLNWSTKYGDPRVAHFIGMHALQVLPLLSFYVLKNIAATITVGLLYFLLATFTLLRALYGKPSFPLKSN
ncbi:hypothetical protein BH11BAC2_BH11BAC2_06170 [soil metagenome]